MFLRAAQANGMDRGSDGDTTVVIFLFLFNYGLKIILTMGKC